MSKKDKNKETNTSGIPAGGLQHSQKGIKHKAGFPGGIENAAGMDNKEKEVYDQKGAKPVSNESLGVSDHKEENQGKD